MKKIISCFAIILFLAVSAIGQEAIPLWPSGKMPNDNGQLVTDSIARERVFRVSEPRMLAFFPSEQENKRAAVLIVPGGGYVRFAHLVSGTQIAKWFNTFGVSAFVLLHRLPQAPNVVDSRYAPIQDAQRALRQIRAHATEWNIDPDKIGVMGFSAGGHLASTLSTHQKDYAAIDDQLDEWSIQPDFAILVSPVITFGKYTHKGSRDNLLGKAASEEDIRAFSNELQVNEKSPPTFLVHAANDPAVSVQNSLLFANALAEKNISFSLHIFPQGGHSIQLRDNPGSANSWTSLCEQWLEEMGFLK